MTGNGNGEYLQTEAWLALEGLRPRISAAIAAALRSEEPLHPAFREKLASALEKRADDPGIRLVVRGAGSGNKDNVGALIETRRRWMIAGRRIAELHAGGMTIDDAKRQVESLEDLDGTIFGFRASQAGDAWRYYLEFVQFRSSPLGAATADLFAGADPHVVEQLVESLFHDDERVNSEAFRYPTAE